MRFTPHLKRCYVFILAFMAINTIAQQQQPCLSALVDFEKEEFPLAVEGEPYEINREIINKNKKLFIKKIACPGGVNCDTTKIKIRAYDMVTDLYSVSRAYLNDDKSGCKNKNCVTGVWIILGMKNNQPKYFFEPAVLKDNGTNSSGVHVFKRVKSQRKTFVYENKKFDSVPHKTLTERKKEYYGKIRIKHNWTKLRKKKGRFEDNSWKGDSRELFYSFQEILGFYSRQNPNETSFYCGNIYINPSAGKFRKKGGWFWRVKHNTFVTVDSGPEMKEKDNVAISESISGTDLAHVCPSNCDDLTYPAATKITEHEKVNKR